MKVTEEELRDALDAYESGYLSEHCLGRLFRLMAHQLYSDKGCRYKFDEPELAEDLAVEYCLDHIWKYDSRKSQARSYFSTLMLSRWNMMEKELMELYD